MDLEEGGTLRRAGPGPDDRPVESEGSWAVEDEVLTLRDKGGERRYQIEETAADKLVLRPLG